jgi:ribosome maturation factor RimP
VEESVAPTRPKIRREAEDRLLDLGIDLVSMDWAGSRNRPVIRLRIERSPTGDAPTGDAPVTVEDCALVSRALEGWLDEHDEIPERYVLEVSSPGVERPLTRPRDWERFVGESVAVEGFGVLAERSSRLEAELLGLDSEPEPTVRLRLGDGAEVGVPLKDIRGAHLLFKWK